MKDINFNLNDYIKIRLRESGRRILTEKGINYIKEDQDGWVKFHLWDLIDIFGESFSCGVHPPFDEDIKLEKNEKMKSVMSIKELMKESHETAVSKGWWEEERNFGEQIALMHSELSEVLEEYRSQGISPDVFIYGSPKPEGIAVEFADLLIRVFDTCERYAIPLEEALEKKMAYNKQREYRHGGKRA